MNKIRLFVDHTLGEPQTLHLNKEQAHNFFKLMRKIKGETKLIFESSLQAFSEENIGPP